VQILESDARQTFWFCAACDSFDAVLQVLSTARQYLNEILSAFEFLDNDALRASSRHLHLSNPVKTAPFYVLVETSGSNSEHDEQKLQSFVDATMKSELVKDGTIATDSSKIKVKFLRNFLIVNWTRISPSMLVDSRMSLLIHRTCIFGSC
jgi:FAD/FMN-containing dehydrogenase